MTSTELLSEVSRHLNQGQLPRAIAACNQFAAKNPDEPRVLLKLSELLLRAGETRTAAGSFQQLAALFEKQGFTAKAIAAQRQALRLHFDEPSARTLARLLEQEGLTRDAIEVLQEIAAATTRPPVRAEVLGQVVRLNPGSVAPRVALAKALIEAVDTPAALGEYRVAVGLLKREGKEGLILRLAERLLALDPQHLELGCAVAADVLELGEAARAVALLEPVREAHPDDRRALDLHARALAAAGEPERAVAAYRLVAVGLLLEGKLDEAAAVWRSVLQLAPGDPEALEKLGPAAAPLRPPTVRAPAASVRPLAIPFPRAPGADDSGDEPLVPHFPKAAGRAPPARPAGSSPPLAAAFAALAALVPPEADEALDVADDMLLGPAEDEELVARLLAPEHAADPAAPTLPATALEPLAAEALGDPAGAALPALPLLRPAPGSSSPGAAPGAAPPAPHALAPSRFPGLDSPARVVVLEDGVVARRLASALRNAGAEVAIVPGEDAARAAGDPGWFVEQAALQGAMGVGLGAPRRLASPELADFCAAVGVQLVGGSQLLARFLGSRLATRRLAGELGIPTVPGIAVEDAAAAERQVEALDGPGLLVPDGPGDPLEVRTAAEVARRFPQARLRALASAGSGRVALEPLPPRCRRFAVWVARDLSGKVEPLGVVEIRRRGADTVALAVPDGGALDGIKELALRLAGSLAADGLLAVLFRLDREGVAQLDCLLPPLCGYDLALGELLGLDLGVEVLRLAAGEPLRSGVRQPGLALAAVFQRPGPAPIVPQAEGVRVELSPVLGGFQALLCARAGDVEIVRYRLRPFARLLRFPELEEIF